MKKLNLIISAIILICSFITINFNIKRYRSFEIQKVLNEDIRFNRPLNQRGMNFINSIDDKYPSLNIFAMPLKAMKAQYLLANDSLVRAIEYLELGSKNNPYLMFSESRLGEVYLKLGDIEKSNFYIRKAFKNLPNNPVHFVLMARVLKTENKDDSIYYYYNKVKDVIGPKDYQVYNIVLAALYLEEENKEKYNLEDIAKEALKFHPDQMSVRKMTDYIFYSQERVDSAEQKYKNALELIKKKDIDGASNILAEVIELHPNVKVYFDNYIIANLNLKRYKPISEIYNQYIETFDEISSEILYYFALSLYNDQKVSTSCEIIEILKTNREFKFDINQFPRC